MDDITLSTKKELEDVELSLQEVENQIQVLLNKQSALQERRNYLKKHLKTCSEKQNASHDWASENFSWSTELREKCETVFGIKSFRPNQLETINTTMSGLDCILVMPTGAGKSLCYQLPALISPGLTLVVCPLISLMEDQVMALEKRGVSAIMLHAGSSKEIVNTVFSDMTRKPCALKLLYVTPEKLAKSKRFMSKLEQCNKVGSLSRIAIDEVHCCSQWGNDFRPDYKFLGILKKQFPKVPLLGLTATASAGVIVDVQKILHVRHAQVYKGSFNRKNLFYSVETKSSNHTECMDKLRDLLQTRFAGQSGIIYCFSRKDTVTIASDLNARGVQAAPYHADLDAEERSNTHGLWLAGSLQVIVATIAFGMGIDKPDVRFVIHHSLSKSMENYYQESGRAGRDDLPAECILMYRLADVYRQSCMVFSEATGLEKLYSMVKYCTDQSACRRTLMAEHFSEVWSESGCGETCDHCDGARTFDNIANATANTNIKLVYDILDKAVQKDCRLTGQKLLDAMLGKGPSQQRVKQTSDLSKDECEYLIACMLTQGHIREDFHFTPYSTISYLVVGTRCSDLIFGSPSSSETKSVKRKASNAAPMIKTKKSAAVSSPSSSKVRDGENEIIVLSD